MTESVANTGQAQSSTAQRRFPVDVEHAGVRIGVPLFAVGALVMTLWGAPRLLEALNLAETQLSLLLFPFAIVAAVLGAYISDRLIKRFFPSQRALLLDDRCLTLRQPNEQDTVIALDGRVNLLSWRFTVPRRGRVPRGHLCLACQLLQDETKITLYTFVAPKKTEVIAEFEAFTPLASRKMLDDDRLSLRMAGQQRRLLQAEDDRWEHGSELTVEDFAAVWAALVERKLVPDAG